MDPVSNSERMAYAPEWMDHFKKRLKPNHLKLDDYVRLVARNLPQITKDVEEAYLADRMAWTEQQEYKFHHPSKRNGVCEV